MNDSDAEGDAASSATTSQALFGRSSYDRAVVRSAFDKFASGRHTFRYETFGDEILWGEQLRLHEAIAGADNGGVGPGISPAAALSLGLKVDVTALPWHTRRALKRGQLDLDDPATTVALLKADAVVGLKGFFDQERLSSIGIQCALCHSEVDDSFSDGVGHRLDGWPNRDLDVGAIIAAAPDLSALTDVLGVDEATLVTVLESWGPGKFDATIMVDGKAFRPDGKSAAVLIPPAYGLAGVNLHTWTGWGSVPYWNAFVANVEMGGQGTFFDPRLADSAKFPVAEENGFDDIRDPNDQITDKLAALQFYQLALPPPEPPRGSFDPAAAQRGKQLFDGKADCARCHVPPLYTEPGWNMHTAEEIGIDDFQAKRSPDERYRTSPLRGLFTRMNGGFYHDGRFATLQEVVDHYDDTFSLGLTTSETGDLVEYLKSL